MNLLEVARQVQAAKEARRQAAERVGLERVANRILIGLERYESVTWGVMNPITGPRYNFLEVDNIRFRLSPDGKALEVFTYNDDPELVDLWNWRRVNDITDLVGMQFGPEEEA